METMKSSTPMMRQYLKIKSENPDTLLFFRLGDFYEMFFEDAVTAARELEITLTSRNNDCKGEPIPMCGVPHHALQSYLVRLIKKGYKVAICEQVEDARQSKGIVRRAVTRIVTPGTTIEEGVLESGSNNYLAALFESGDQVGASFLDLSTGEFWLTQDAGAGAWDQIRERLEHFRPRELVLPEGRAESVSGKLGRDVQSSAIRTCRPDWTFQGDHALRQLLDHFQVATLEGFGVNGEKAAVSAAGALLYYLRQTQKAALSHITRIHYFEPARYLRLDESTVRNLELVECLDGGRRWTLLATLDRTRTGMGARLLRSWVLRPSTDLEEIDGRLDAVDELHRSAVRMGRLARDLEPVYDLQRLLSRVTLGTANARDLLALKSSFQALPGLAAHLQQCTAALLQPDFDLLEDLADLLERAVDPEAPATLGEGRLIRPGYHGELDDLRAVASSGKSYIASLEAKERESSGISNLKVKFNRVFGYFIEVTKSQLAQVPERYVRKQTLVNCERFVTPELKEYEEKVLGAEERIVELERELFLELRSRLAGDALRIQETAGRVAELDVLLALAETAHRNGYKRPRLDDGTQLEIEGGRHPVLERQGDDPFVANDLVCDTEDSQLLILTGPNMGGKSTYLRQNALIVLLAQMGSFVPADRARVGLVDRIYTRVGASDNLARGRSTFMVEMIETANILNTATPRSLILLDEVGRGTATFDGLSLAWSIAEYLANEPGRRARTLFATHYQELTQLERIYRGVRNYCVSVRESGGRIMFFHKVRPGVASKSYGIEVARLAGLPQPVLNRAREILGRLERKEINVSGRRRSSSTHDVIEELQPALF